MQYQVIFFEDGFSLQKIFDLKNLLAAYNPTVSTGGPEDPVFILHTNSPLTPEDKDAVLTGKYVENITERN
jgi:hypothetical protein